MIAWPSARRILTTSFHITTRQDVQLHFVHIEETPDMFRRLAAVGITTREACGNSVRNVTACPWPGLQDRDVDVSPYPRRARLSAGHRDTRILAASSRSRFRGASMRPAPVTIHDLGGIAKVRDGKRGFALYVAAAWGGSQQAKLMFDFLAEEELLPHGPRHRPGSSRGWRKENRNRARLKFVVQNWASKSSRSRTGRVQVDARGPFLAEILRTRFPMG